MNEFTDAGHAAWRLVVSLDPTLAEIVYRSLMVSVIAVGLSALVGFAVGALLAVARFPGRKFVVVLMNAGMGMPPVVIGLVVYLLLSRSGPFGGLGLLFTPTAMIIAQSLLVFPIICSLSRQVIEDLLEEYAEQFRSFDLGVGQVLRTLLWEGRFRLLTALLAGFGRAIAEVGAVLIVGGNIAHVTRVMTTAIALETARGDLALALGLGLILITTAFAVNAAAYLIRDYAERHAA
ncbi:MAG: ABC transporter permease [Gammaproteobacteria bacterium]|nr:ABC transporter permease [Gammaproteobacteria bacterium]